MKLFHWLVTAPAALIVVIFAVANRETVTLSFWPLPLTLEAPVYLIVLLALLAGFLLGELAAWLNGRYWRREARRMRRRAEDLERALAERSAATEPKGVVPGQNRPPTAPARQIAHN